MVFRIWILTLFPDALPTTGRRSRRHLWMACFECEGDNATRWAELPLVLIDTSGVRTSPSSSAFGFSLALYLLILV